MRNEKRITFKIELPDSLERAIATLEGAGGLCRITGGAVRDALLGLQPKDIDVEVYGLSLDAVAKTLEAVGKTNMTGKSFCVVKLRIGSQEYDFSIPRKESKNGVGHRGFTIEPDPNLSEKKASVRRDFTINALLYDHTNRQVVDYHGGLEDLNDRALRHIDEAFREDPLRPLRAMQFAGRFDFSIHSETAKMCASLKGEYSAIPIERIWTEWEKWASKSKKPSAGLRVLKEMGWLSFYPELRDLQDVPQEPEWHPEGDVWQHTLHCIDAMVAQKKWIHAEADERCSLLLAILCHDFGKPLCTKQMEKKGKLRWTSHGHADLGVPLAESFLKRIGAFQKIAAPVPNLVQKHHFLVNAEPEGPSHSSLRKLARKLAPATASQLSAVMSADTLGRPPLLNEEKLRQIQDFKKRMQDLELDEKGPEPILLGRHLIAEGKNPGPDFKKLLEKALEGQLEGHFSTSEAGIEWLRSENLL